MKKANTKKVRKLKPILEISGKPELQACAVVMVEGGLKVYTPYNIEFIEAIKEKYPKSKRKWDPETKCWHIMVDNADEVVNWLKSISEAFAVMSDGGLSVFIVENKRLDYLDILAGRRKK